VCVPGKRVETVAHQPFELDGVGHSGAETKSVGTLLHPTTTLLFKGYFGNSRMGQLPDDQNSIVSGRLGTVLRLHTWCRLAAGQIRLAESLTAASPCIQ
jgi:hypothetical protein